MLEKEFKQVMKYRNIGQQKLAEKLGYLLKEDVLSWKKGSGDPRAISRKLVKNSLGIKTLIKWLAFLDYELVLQPKISGTRRDGTIVVTSVEEE
jgi:hypothetical protein